MARNGSVRLTGNQSLVYRLSSLDLADATGVSAHHLLPSLDALIILVGSGARSLAKPIPAKL